MNKVAKIGLLSLIAIVQALTLVGGFFAFRQMSEALMSLQRDYVVLHEEAHGLRIDFGINPNPFAPLFPLVLFGLFLTVVLVVDQIRCR